MSLITLLIGPRDKLPGSWSSEWSSGARARIGSGMRLWMLGMLTEWITGLSSKAYNSKYKHPRMYTIDDLVMVCNFESAPGISKKLLP